MRPARPRTRLGIERLEDRTVPATFTVTNTNDSGNGSLRDAIAAANPADTIVFNSTFNTPKTIVLTGGPLAISRAVTITGPGADLLTISGNNASRVFTIDDGDDTTHRQVAISGLTITGGNATVAAGGSGGGVSSREYLTLTRVVVTGNAAVYSGGGVYAWRGLGLTESTVAGNTAGQDGGGVFLVDGSDMDLTRSTVSGNRADGNGGGLLVGTGAYLQSVASTISGNAGKFGGGLTNFGYVDMANTTVAGNTATSSGGGLYRSNTTTLNLKSTIVAGNTAASAGPDVSGAVTDQGYNLVGNTAGSSGWGATTLQNKDPLLGPLASGGGPTKVRGLRAGSPAINAGDPADTSLDQRKVARVTSRRDIGAVEAWNPSSLSVASTSDVADGTFDGANLTLREAVGLANAAPGPTTVVFSALFDSPQTITLCGGALDVVNDLTVTGPGANTLTVSGNNAARVFNVDDFTTANKSVTLSGLTITGGKATGAGGGVYAAETLTLDRVAVSGNTATGTGGGLAVAAGASAAITNSTISGNQTTDSAAPGGGVFVGSGGTLKATASTFAGNSAGFVGGGLSVHGTATLNRCTVAGNTAAGNAGVDNYHLAGTVRLRGTVVAGNTSVGNLPGTGPDTGPSMTDQGYNLIGSTTGSTGFTAATTLKDVDPRLGPLANYGGPTPTRVLGVGSPAVNTGDPSDAATDQRGQAVAGGRRDIGAFEFLNRAPTAVALSNASVNENAGANAAVGTLTATDPDYLETFTFTLPAGFGDNAAFSLSGTTLRATGSFDHETKSSYSVKVRAADAGGLTLEQTFTVTVLDRNDAPTSVTLSNSTIAENRGLSAVGVLAAVDQDAANTHTFTLVSGTGSDDNARFAIDPADGKTLKTTAGGLNFEEKSSYKVRVRATDNGAAARGGPLSVEVPLTITVTNVNEGPTAITPATLSVAENAGADALVATLGAADPDAGDTFTFALVSGAGDADNPAFAVDADGKTLLARAGLDFETRSSYSVRLRVTDAAGLTLEQARTVTVTDVNEAPTGLALSRSSVAENAGANAAVGTLSAADPDLGDTFTYSLPAGQADNVAFDISGATLRATGSFDYETKPSYSVVVRVTDSGGLTFDRTFTVAVTDINEAPTGITPAALSIPENGGANAPVAVLGAADPDAGDTFTFALVSGAGDADNPAFAVDADGKTLLARAGLDYEARSSYSVRLRVTDAAGLTLEQARTVTVLDANDPPTGITPAALLIPENAGANAAVTVLGATDPDAGDTAFTFTLVPGAADNALFAIDPDGKTLRVLAGFDYEARSAYAVRLTVADPAGATFTATLPLAVTDVNEAPAAVALAAAGGLPPVAPAVTVLGTLSAIDPDAADTHTFALVAGAGDNALFEVVGTELRAKGPLDLRDGRSYTAVVTAADAGGLTVTGSVTVTAAARNTVAAGGLIFSTTGQFTPNGSLFTATGLTSVGFLQNGAFLPVLRVPGTVAVDVAAGSFSLDGSVEVLTDSGYLTLLAAGTQKTVRIADLLAASPIGSGLFAGRAFTAAGVSFQFGGLTLVADGSPAGRPEVRLRGTLTLPGGLEVAVDGDQFVGVSTAGVRLTGVTARLADAAFTVAGFTLDARQLVAGYAPAGNTFTLTGPVTLTAPGFGAVAVTLGDGGTAGLVVAGGVLTSFDATASLDTTAAGGRLASAAAGLRVRYDAADDEIGVSGGAALTFDGGRSLALSLGTAADPGLVFQGGKFVRLTAAADLVTTLAGGTFTATAVTAEYTPPAAARAGRFALSGDATLAFDSGRTATLGLGTAADPGLVIEGGKVTRVAATGALATTLAGAAFTATDLRFLYSAGTAAGEPDRFSVSGAAALTFGDHALALTLGSAANPGLVIESGRVLRLQATAALPDFAAGGVTLTAAAVGVTYTADPERVAITGAATLTAAGLDPLTVLLGTPAAGDDPGTAGLVITNGDVTAIDAAVTGGVTVGGVSFAAAGLRVVGDLPARTYHLTGATTVAVAGVGTLSVALGGGDTAGLVIADGVVTDLTATVTSQLALSRVRLTADDLILTYSRAAGTYTVTGRATLKAGGVADIAVELGGAGTAGLVITNGVLTSLNMAVTGTVAVGGLTFAAEGLTVAYDRAAGTYTIAGTTRTAAGGVGEVAVVFGGGGSAGLVITDGAVTALDMAVSGSVTVGGLALAVDGARVTYADGEFTLSGAASVALGRFGTVALRLGERDAAGAVLSTGLVVRDGSLRSLDATLDADLTFSGLTLATDGLRLVYSAADRRYSVTGRTTAAVPSAGTVQVTLGGGLTAGLVVADGTLATLEMTVDSTLTVAGVTFRATALTLAYSAADGGRFTVTGTAAMTAGTVADVGVRFGSTSPATAGLVVKGGALDSLDVAVTSSFAVGGLTFSTNGLRFTYAAADRTFTLTGAAAVELATGGTPALVQVRIGSTAADADADGNPLPETAGLVVRDGTLESLDVAVTSRFRVAGVEFGTDGLRFTYDTATRTFTLTGGASFAMTVGTGAVAVAVRFGSATTDTDADGNPLPATRGLVVTDGAFVSLDVAVTSQFAVGGLTFGTDALRFTYDAPTQTFTLTGGASFALTAPAVSFAVRFGSTAADVDAAGRPLPPTAGLVVRAGRLVSLDVAVTSSFTLAGVEFGTDALRVTYDVATRTFTLSGGAFFRMTSPAVAVAVRFGSAGTDTDTDGNPLPATRGLVVTDGAFVSLDVAVTSSFTTGGITFGTNALRFTYDAPTKTFTLSGGAFARSAFFTGRAVDVQFGGVLNTTDAAGRVTQQTTRGLVVTDGNLTYLDVALTSTFQVGAVTFFTKALRLTYTPATNEYTLGGTAGADIARLGTVDLRLGGDGQTQGLLIRDGEVVSLDATLTAALGVGGLSFGQANLRFAYDKATATYTVSGASQFSLGGVLTLQVDLGGSYTDASGKTVRTAGLVVRNGQLVSLDMSVRAALQVGGLTFASGQFVMSYASATRTFTLTGRTTVNLGGVGALNVELGGGGTAGLVITNGTLTALNMRVNSNIGVSGFQIVVDNLTLAYAAAGGGSRFTITGSGSLNIGPVTFAVALGTNGQQGLVIDNGQLTRLDARVSTGFGIAGLFSLGSATLDARYDRAAGTFEFRGVVDVTLSVSLPSWALTFLRQTFDFRPDGLHIGTVGLRMRVVYGRNDLSFVQFWVEVGGVEAGIKVWFDGNVSVTLGDALSKVAGAFQDLGREIDRAYKATAAALADVYREASNGVVKAYTITVAALDAAYDALVRAGEAIGDAIEDGARAVGDWFAGWGYLDGAVAFYDPTGAGVFDPAYPHATTDADGRFDLTLPADPPAAAVLVVTGGVDTSTRRANTLTLAAPVSARAINPLTTTAVGARQVDRGLSVAAAAERVRTGLGLAAAVDLLNDDLIARALDPAAPSLPHAAAFGREVAVSAVAHMVTALVGGGRPLGDGPTDVSPDVFRALAAACGAAVNLADPAQAAALIRGTAARSGVLLPADLVAAAADVVAAVVAAIDAVPAAATRAYLEAVVRVQTVGETTVADALADAVRGLRTPAALRADFTGDPLAALIAGRTIGVVTPPAVTADGVTQGVGAGRPATFRFPVYLAFAGGPPGAASRPLPVTVHYSTEDGTATADDGDYAPVSGTLTWAGDFTAVQYVEVPVGPGSGPAADGYFLLRLTDPTNAVLPQAVAVGRITGTTFATATALTTSAADTVYGSAVTLTAAVTGAEGRPVPADGAVEFHAGDALLGTAATDADGRATLAAGDVLPPGGYILTAVYRPFAVVGGDYLPSTSAGVGLTVAPQPHTITFGSLADRTYGEAPSTLTASSSAGLPVTFTVLSGPATVAGDGTLTLIGAGEVVVRASQPGTATTAAADPVDRSFRVSKARLVIAAGSVAMTYRGAVPSLPYLVDGLVNGDTLAGLAASDGLAVVTTATAASGVGVYPITTSVTTTANYDLEVTPGELTVTPAPLVLAVADVTAAYGQTPAFTYSAVGLLDGDTLTGDPVYSGFGTRPGVGAYPVTVAGPANPNYAVAVLPGSLTVTRAALTITADDQTMTYGGGRPALTVRYAGFASGEGPADLFTPAAVETAPAGAAAGAYPITVGNATAANYAIAFVPGTLTVAPAPLTVTAADVTMIVGDPVPALTVGYAGLVNGDTPADLAAGGTATTDATGQTAGAFVIAVAGAADPNYAVTHVPGRLTVLRQPVRVDVILVTEHPVAGRALTVAVAATNTHLDQPLAAREVRVWVDGIDRGTLALGDDGTGGLDLSGLRLAAGVHLVTVAFAGDATQAPATGTLEVEVGVPLGRPAAPANAAPTDLRLAGGTAAENAPAGTPVGVLTGSDPDAGDVLTFAVVPVDGVPAAFEAVGTELRTLAPFDYEATPTQHVRVRATDAGGLWFERGFAVTVLDAPDAPTGATLTPAAVAENAVVGTVVGRLAAVDQDAGEAHTYELLDGAGGRFRLGGDRLLVAGPLDYETAAAHTVRVRVTDAAGLSAEQDLTVAVLDVGEVTGFVVGRGRAQRSLVRYLGVTLDTPAAAAALARPGRVRLVQRDLAGNGPKAVTPAGWGLSADGRTMTVDFGAQGVGGNRNSNAADGYYTLEVDADGDGTFESARSFYRLLGDTNGDRRVDQADADAVAAVVAANGFDPNADVNGDGVVNGTDKLLVQRLKGRALTAGLPLDG